MATVNVAILQNNQKMLSKFYVNRNWTQFHGKCNTRLLQQTGKQQKESKKEGKGKGLWNYMGAPECSCLALVKRLDRDEAGGNAVVAMLLLCCVI